jgi:hypothetical protein
MKVSYSGRSDGSRWLRWKAILVASTMSTAWLRADQTLTNSAPEALRAAVQTGGTVKFAFDGTVALTNWLVITTNTTLDATGHTVSIDGGNAVRHFSVTNGATLRLVNLSLVNGRFAGTNGGMGFGGSIYSAGSQVELLNCRFLSNNAAGGKGSTFSIDPPFVLVPADGGPAAGGAIYAIGGSLSLSHCLFVGNASKGGEGGTEVFGRVNAPGGDAVGGAICVTNCALTALNVSFSNNIAWAGEASFGPNRFGGGLACGGAVYETSPAVALSHCVFVANKALAGSRWLDATYKPSGDAFGGAVFHNSGTLSVVGTIFQQNSVTGGPGRGNVQLTVSGDGNGGAVYGRSGIAEFKDSALVGNQANGGASSAPSAVTQAGTGRGGGMCVTSSVDLRMANCTLADNSANGGSIIQGGILHHASAGSGFGGAIAGQGSLLNVTLSGNSARIGTGTIGNDLFDRPSSGGSSISGNMSLTNTILTCAAGETNVSGTITDGGHNICSDSSANFTLPSSRNSLDPLLAPLADNGGPTPTLALLPSSPAIDAGDASVCTATDQRGIARPQGFGCDIGAFELVPTLTLTEGPDAFMTLNCTFQAGRTNTVQASTNLVDWSILGIKVSDTNGAFDFLDPDSIRLPHRFYQVR